jgi:hypothetical protein
MTLFERRDALKAAGATALATALTATASTLAQEPEAHAPAAGPANKERKPTGPPNKAKWHYGCLKTIGAGSMEFTFSIVENGVELGFELEHQVREWAAPIVMLAFEKGLPLWVTAEQIPHTTQNSGEGFLARYVLLERK